MEQRMVTCVCGQCSHVGNRNPNYGNTSDTLTPEKRRKFSEAAIKRVLAGVSGYKTGHVTGIYECKKSNSPVHFKSSWELAAMMWWDTQDAIKSYEYEPLILQLSDGRAAIPDFRVIYVDGITKFFEIKPTAIQQLESVKTKLNMIRDELCIKGFEYVLLGNAEIRTMIVEVGDKFNDALKRY